ncbi:hypothetical protein V1511DRAFT_245602 [Dipodascopsis uninucleata]
MIEEDTDITHAYFKVPMALDNSTSGQRTEYEGSFKSIMPNITDRISYKAVKLRKGGISGRTGSNNIMHEGSFVVDRSSVSYVLPCSEAPLKILSKDIWPSFPHYNEKENEDMYVGGDLVEESMRHPKRSQRQRSFKRILNKRKDNITMIKNRILKRVVRSEESLSCFQSDQKDSECEGDEETPLLVSSIPTPTLYCEDTYDSRNASTGREWPQMHDYSEICLFCLEQIATCNDYEQAADAKRKFISAQQGQLSEDIESRADAVFWDFIDMKRRSREQQQIEEAYYDYKTRPQTPDQYANSPLTRVWSEDRIQAHWNTYQNERADRVMRKFWRHSERTNSQKRKFFSIQDLSRKWKYFKRAFEPSYYYIRSPTDAEDNGGWNN